MTNHIPYKSIFCTLLILALCFTLCGCGDKEPVPVNGIHVPDQPEENYGVMAEVRTPFEDPEYEELFITAVRNAVPEDYPDITIGEAYDHYFSSPEWSAFEGAS